MRFSSRIVASLELGERGRVLFEIRQAKKSKARKETKEARFSKSVSLENVH